jgi:hypothetical protein
MASSSLILAFVILGALVDLSGSIFDMYRHQYSAVVRS